MFVKVKDTASKTLRQYLDGGRTGLYLQNEGTGLRRVPALWWHLNKDGSVYDMLRFTGVTGSAKERRRFRESLTGKDAAGEEILEIDSEQRFQ